MSVKQVLRSLGIIGSVAGLFLLASCDMNAGMGAEADIENQVKVGDKLSANQPTPTDIDYSLERYNLIRRAYWVNGMRDKAINLQCPIQKPLGYIYLFSEQGKCLGMFNVDGKVSSLGSYLTPSYDVINEYYRGNLVTYDKELPDVDGCYGSNDLSGIFFFTTDGKYLEWTGDYLYSDIPFVVKDTVFGYEE